MFSLLPPLMKITLCKFCAVAMGIAAIGTALTDHAFLAVFPLAIFLITLGLISKLYNDLEYRIYVSLQSHMRFVHPPR